MPTCTTNKEGKIFYPCTWHHCEKEHSACVNTCTHLHCDHLHQVLLCVVCDSHMFSMGTFMVHMKTVHPGVQKTLAEVDAPPTAKKSKAI